MNLYTAATAAGTTHDLGGITIIDFGDAYGTMAVLSIYDHLVRRALEHEQGTGILSRDISLLVQLYDTRVTRPGSQLKTCGANEKLMLIAQHMNSLAIDCNAWNFPRVVKQAMRQHVIDEYSRQPRSAA